MSKFLDFEAAESHGSDEDEQQEYAEDEPSRKVVTVDDQIKSIVNKATKKPKKKGKRKYFHSEDEADDAAEDSDILSKARRKQDDAEDSDAIVARKHKKHKVSKHAVEAVEQEESEAADASDTVTDASDASDSDEESIDLGDYFSCNNKLDAAQDAVDGFDVSKAAKSVGKAKKLRDTSATIRDNMLALKARKTVVHSDSDSESATRQEKPQSKSELMKETVVQQLQKAAARQQQKKSTEGAPFDAASVEAEDIFDEALERIAPKKAKASAAAAKLSASEKTKHSAKSGVKTKTPTKPKAGGQTGSVNGDEAPAIYRAPSAFKGVVEPSQTHYKNVGEQFKISGAKVEVLHRGRVAKTVMNTTKNVLEYDKTLLTVEHYCTLWHPSTKKLSLCAMSFELAPMSINKVVGQAIEKRSANGDKRKGEAFRFKNVILNEDKTPKRLIMHPGVYEKLVADAQDKGKTYAPPRPTHKVSEEFEAVMTDAGEHVLLRKLKSDLEFQKPSYEDLRNRYLMHSMDIAAGGQETGKGAGSEWSSLCELHGRELMEWVLKFYAAHTPQGRKTVKEYAAKVAPADALVDAPLPRAKTGAAAAKS